MQKRTCKERVLDVARIVCLIGAVVAAGCAKHRGASLEVHPPAPVAAPAAPRETLSSFMAKVRKLASEAATARPARDVATLESTDPELGAALFAATVAPSPAAYREVAKQYARNGIIDTAHAYLNDAVRLDPRDAATYEALARLWRDWRVPHLALGDAYRAVYWAPGSASAHNTLGTVLQAMGRRSDARREYERAIELDPRAAYALNNLCYAWILEDQAKKAVGACERAIEIDPSLRAARNNLGLAHGASSDMAAARLAFDAAGDDAASHFNQGIVHLARREYRSAVRAFEAAQTLRPAFKSAEVRARQAREMALGGGNE